MGILQHHDAVSGTEKQAVANDYIATALKYIGKFSPLYTQILSEQINKEIGENIASTSIYTNLYWNETAKITGVADKISNNKTVLLALYNSGPAEKRIIKVNVPSHDLKLTDWDNKPITGDVFCSNLYDAANC